MTDLQDQKIMHQYFADMLFQPLAEELEQSLQPVQPVPIDQKQAVDLSPVLSPLKTGLEQDLENGLLPLPARSPMRQAASAPQVASPVVELAIEDLDTEEVANEPNPWATYCWENDRPPWAQQTFDCLLFEVCGFHFALPLITLGQIQMLTTDLSPVFGQAPWFMGIQATPMGKLRVVNTAQFVMPERYKPEPNYRPSYMISIANCHWALAVDKVNQPINLSPAGVKWRRQREKQSWLAGVVKQQMCVLIDIPALAKQLIEMDRNSHESLISSR